MFTQKCFIRKNTSSLFKRLEQIGGRSGVAFQHEKYNTLTASPDFFRCVRDDSTELLINDGYIDCRTNDELFLAIAALRDDSDYMQWFVSDATAYWLQHRPCFDDDPNKDNAYSVIRKDKWHKATIEELIEHFRTE